MKRSERKKILGGVILSLIGFSWLAEDMGWVKVSIPITPLILLIIGIYLIIESAYK